MAHARAKRDTKLPGGGSTVQFRAKLLRPAAAAGATWTFLKLPAGASAKLRSRGMVSADCVIHSIGFKATLEPDGQGAHWMKVSRKVREAAGVTVGMMVDVELSPMAEEPEPVVPVDFRKALAAAPKARSVWADITPMARRDWIRWITSGKRAETRSIRITKACDMLAKGKRRACCFDRSGMYSKSMSCPVADTNAGDVKQ